MAEGSLFKRCSCKDDTGRRLGSRCPQLHRGAAWNPVHGQWGYQLELPHHPDRPRWQLRRTGFDSRDQAIAERAHAQSLLALAAGDPTVAVDIAALLRSVRFGQPLPDRDELARRLRAGLVASDAMTVGRYLSMWLAGRQVQSTTRLAYEGHIRLYLQPHLGHIPVDKLRVAHVQAMFDTLAARIPNETGVERARSAAPGNPTGNPPGNPPGTLTGTLTGNLSGKLSGAATVRAPGGRRMTAATLHRIRATLRKALNDAIRAHRLIEFNPAAHVELPTGRRPKARVWTAAAITEWRRTRRRPSPVMVWTPDLAGQFLDYAQRHDIMLYPAFTLILHRGLRRGEALGLRDSDIDLEHGTLTIVQQLATVGYRPVLKTLKSDTSDRVITLDTNSAAAIRDHLHRRHRWQQVSGTDWPDTGLLFVQPDGTAWHPDTVTNRFDHLISQSGLPPIRLHDLRHCAATYLKAAGADLKDIQHTLGHSSITITADTYTSVLTELEQQRLLADHAAALIPRQSPTIATPRRPAQERS